MKLIYTPKSHFARKVRLLLDGLGEVIELVDAGNVASSSTGNFASNPLMMVPALVDGDATVFDSDNIAHYLVRKLDPGDRFDVRTLDVDQCNARAVMNGVMSAEVELLLAKRTGIDVTKFERFSKKRQTLGAGLNWLERHAGIFPASATYLGFHLVAMLDHLELQGMVDVECPSLASHVAMLSEMEFVTRSRPPR